MPQQDLTFLASPGQVADWRLVLLYDAAIATGLVEALPGTSDGVASELGLDPHSVRVVFDALVALGVLAAGADGSYATTREGPERDAAPTLRHHARAIRRWASGLEACLRGEPVPELTGTVEPAVFHDALASSARRAAPKVVDACLARFPGARSVLDLGGLHGEYSLEFTRRGLKATMQDLPPMIYEARRRGRLEEAGVELFEGSFFDVVPDGPFDLAFCSGITHTFDGERNLTLYRNLRPVVAPGGGVAVVTFLRGDSPITALFAVQMLVNAHGGDTHTEAEYRSWLRQAGFTPDEDVLRLSGDDAARSVLFAT